MTSNMPEGKIPVFLTEAELGFLLRNIDSNIAFALNTIIQQKERNDLVDRLVAANDKFKLLRDACRKACTDENLDPATLIEQYGDV